MRGRTIRTYFPKLKVIDTDACAHSLEKLSSVNVEDKVASDSEELRSAVTAAAIALTVTYLDKVNEPDNGSSPKQMK